MTTCEINFDPKTKLKNLKFALATTSAFNLKLCHNLCNFFKRRGELKIPHTPKIYPKKVVCQVMDIRRPVFLIL